MAAQVEHIKWVPGTSLMVDGFAFANPRCSNYFLTHCHSDHTIGLKRSFPGTIYCSAVSARLLAKQYGFQQPQVVVLQLGQPVVVEGVTVTAIDANHCPGAVMLLFEVPSTAGNGVTRILHTGDCRWKEELHANSCLVNKPVHTLMLDTTYAMPRYTFPSQQEAVKMMVQVMQSELADEPDCLFVVGSYHIGKERAYLGAAYTLGWKVYAPPAKMEVLQLLGLPPEQTALLTDDASAARLHVAPMASPDPIKLATTYLKPGAAWKRVVAFRPTGWSYSKSGKLQVWRQGRAAVYGVPYSEHSSWNDLRACVKTLRPKKIIPTVNAATRSQAKAIVERFVDLMDLSSSKGRLDSFLIRTPKASLAADSGPDVTTTPADQCFSSANQVLSRRTSPSSQYASMACLKMADFPCSQEAGETCGFEDQTRDSISTALLDISLQADSAAALSVAVQDSCCSPTSCGCAQLTSGCVPTYLGTTVQKPCCFAATPKAVTSQSHQLQQQQQQHGEEAVLLDGSYDFSSVDLAQQQRLLDEAQRVMRLKRTIAAAGKGNCKKRRSRCS